MASGTFGDQVRISLQAAASLTAQQFHIVRISAANQCNVASNALGQTTVGVLQNKPAINQAAEIAIFGETKLVAGAAIATVGDYISTNGSGRAIAAVSGSAVMGMALTNPGADGEIFRAVVFPPYFTGNL
jgi:hypothetical protein